ncbi:MAG TPA: carboxylesterase family protein [Polyangiaceae bacterium]|nr:carboxylesterase family protein [Polyangiaceae bacterium]
MKRAIAAMVGALALVSGVARAGDGTGRPIALTDRGLVVGVHTANGNQFLGIPYAAPPVGDLRWRPPHPVAPWIAPRDASKFANHCPQVATPFGVASTTEDCLYLNVYTPTGLGVLRPVMVYIHGGAFQTGEGDDYGPRRLLDQGVVVVTINYRLGALGFFADSGLAAEAADGSTGNYGLMDQQAALRWVRKNILAFGGDPDNVTIFGESAGGLSVHAHLASPKSKKLFAQAIAESGSYALTQPTLSVAETAGAAYATAVGCSAADTACLRAVPVSTLLANQSLSATAYMPVVDGTVLTQSIGAAFASGQFNQVPVIEGSNHDEFRLFVAFLFELPNGPVTAAQYPAYVAALLGLPSAVAAQVVPLVLAQYPLSNYASPALALGAIGTDAAFSCNTLTVQKSLQQFVPTWAYEFQDANAPQRYLPPVSFPYGAYHEAELQYLFDVPVTVPAPALTADQEQLAAAMDSYWTTFARRGNPNSPATPRWQPQTSSSDFTEALVAPTPQPYTATAEGNDHMCAFWQAIFAGG